jgi:hypothetical protein
MSSCELTDVKASTGYNARWQDISVPIPDGYTCDDLDPLGCWVKLQYSYGSGNQPSDTTSWTASLEGDPVRIIR